MMLGHVTTAFILCIIWLNLLGLALLGYGLIRCYPLSRAATPLIFALAAFFFEHFVGLGRLTWLWPLTTVYSLWAVRRHWRILREHSSIEAAFLVSFGWAFAWRFSYPGIVASSEKITGLAMISCYLPGDRLPPVDVWLPPFRFDVYYSFQHYAAALGGRIFGLDPGTTYNVAFCLVIALTGMCAATFALTVCKSKWRSALVIAALLLGGTGATWPVHLMMQRTELHSSMRFIGGTATYQHTDTPWAKRLLEVAGVPKDGSIEIPSETFAYLTSLGDYHPPLSGFYLLMLALTCMAMLEAGTETRFSQAILALSIPVCMIANSWSLPLQAMLVLAWIAYRIRERRPPDWRMLGTGALAGAAVCYPFLNTFAYRSADYNVKLRLVPPGEHTPVLLGIIVLFPVLIGVLLPLVSGERKRWAVWSSVMWLAFLAISEICYVDDIYSGPFNRFNTTLKWWPWIQAGALLTAGAYGIRSGSRLCRYGTIAILTLVSSYGLDMLRALSLGTKVDFGRLDGAAWITDDNIEKPILEFLKAQPPGIVLQHLEAGAFTPAPALVMFARQKAFLGWPEHEKLWRGQRADIDLRAAEVRAFYNGQLARPAEWLIENNIDYVLWLKTEYKLAAGTFDKINDRIKNDYFWREYYRAGEFRVGFWSRRVNSPFLVP